MKNRFVRFTCRLLILCAGLFATACTQPDANGGSEGGSDSGETVNIFKGTWSLRYSEGSNNYIYYYIFGDTTVEKADPEPTDVSEKGTYTFNTDLETLTITMTQYYDGSQFQNIPSPKPEEYDYWQLSPDHILLSWTQGTTRRTRGMQKID